MDRFWTSWKRLGGVLGPSWVVLGLLGPSWAVLWAPCGVLGRLGPFLMPSWAISDPLGGVLGSSWAVLAPSWGPLRASWGRLGGVLGTSQKQPIRLTTPHPAEAHFSGRFWGAPATLMETKIASGSLQNAFFAYHFLGCVFGWFFVKFLIASSVQLASNLSGKIC